MVPLCDLQAQYENIMPEVHEAIANVLDSSAFILGEEVTRFEEEFAEFCGANYCVGVACGLDALKLILLANGIDKTEDEVIIPANTFVATALAVSHAGASIKLVDCDYHTQLMKVGDVPRVTTPNTQAVIPVHLYGQMADVEYLDMLTDSDAPDGQLPIMVIEDACQAHGARLSETGLAAGSWSDAAAFSFYPAKNLGCYGDGGAVVTDSERIAKTVRHLRDYGQSAKYIHSERGVNSRLDSIQAAVLRVKLKHLTAWNARRAEIAQRYNEAFKGNPAIYPVKKKREESVHVYHQYVVRVDNRSQLMRKLGQDEIGCGIHYPVPIHLQPCYAHLGLRRGSFPNAEKSCGEVMSLPIYPEMSDDQVDRVVECLRRAVDECLT